jgi:hypothetical protein
MEPRTAKLIVEKILGTLNNAGFKLGKFGAALAGEVGESPETAEVFIRKYFKDTMVAQYEKYPEPSSEELTQILIDLETAPVNVRKILMTMAKTVRAQVGGRPRLLAANNNEAKLCARVSKLLADSIPEPEAIQTAATRFGVTRWTAHRAWKRYRKAQEERRRHTKPRHSSHANSRRPN